MAFLYVRTELVIPGAGTAIHIAELEEAGAQICTMHRLIALDAGGVIMGLAEKGKTAGNVDMPSKTVPHPDTYDQFPDISSSRITHDEFEGLWSEAKAKFPR